ncbi:MAG: glycosyltransferase family 4 protein [Ruminococcus sp.]|nr:glycosyltransferase family 4 protein [Ruminococcus sp.]
MSKILILANHYNTLRIFRRELIKKLDFLGHEVIISIPPDEQKEIDLLESYGSKVILTNMERRGMNPVKDISLLRRYKKLIKSVNPDKVITYTIKPNIYGSMACKALKVPHYCNVTGLGSAFMADGGLMRTLVSVMYKFSMNKAEKIFFENVGNRDTLVKSKVVKAEQTVVMAGAGVNLDEFAFCEYPEDDGMVHFLNVGRIMQEKGMDELFYAIRKIKAEYPTTTFDFIGWYEDNYKDTVEKLQAENLIRFHGFQSNVIPFIEKAHCIVHPSYHEGMSNTLLESCSMGRPIITSNIHGCLEAVDDGKNGFLCNVKDGEDLYLKIKKFIQLPYAEKKAMGEYARKFVERNFNKNDVVDKTIEEIGL